jgi:hypothetical protein
MLITLLKKNTMHQVESSHHPLLQPWRWQRRALAIQIYGNIDATHHSVLL